MTLMHVNNGTLICEKIRDNFTVRDLRSAGVSIKMEQMWSLRLHQNFNKIRQMEKEVVVRTCDKYIITYEINVYNFILLRSAATAQKKTTLNVLHSCQIVHEYFNIVPKKYIKFPSVKVKHQQTYYYWRYQICRKL